MFIAIAVGFWSAIQSMYERNESQSIEKSGSIGSIGAATMPCSLNAVIG